MRADASSQLDFASSSHGERWMFTEEQLTASDRRSVADPRGAFTPDEVWLLKLLYTQYIQALGRRVRMRQRAIATATVYFRRFYAIRSLLDHDPLLVAIVAVLMASKTEECVVSPKHLAREVRELDHLSNPYSVKDIAEAEFSVLETLKFDLLVFQPYAPLQNLLADAELRSRVGPERSETFVTTAWYLLNDCFRTDLVLCHAPHVIALACIHCAGLLMSVPIRQWVPPQPDVRHESIERVAAQLWALYEAGTKLAPKELTALHDRLSRHWDALRPAA